MICLKWQGNNMKNKIIIFCFIILFIQCLPVSINPPYTNSLIVTDSTIIGAWRAEWIGYPSESPKTIIVSQFDSVHYLVTYDSSTLYSASLTIIKGEPIASFTFASNLGGDEKNCANILHIPGYFIAKVKIVSKDTLNVGIFDIDSLVSASKKLGISVATYYGGSSLITASPEKVRYMISKCLKNKLFIKGTIILTRIK